MTSGVVVKLNRGTSRFFGNLGTGMHIQFAFLKPCSLFCSLGGGLQQWYFVWKKRFPHAYRDSKRQVFGALRAAARLDFVPRVRYGCWDWLYQSVCYDIACIEWLVSCWSCSRLGDQCSTLSHWYYYTMSWETSRIAWILVYWVSCNKKAVANEQKDSGVDFQIVHVVCQACFTINLQFLDIVTTCLQILTVQNLGIRCKTILYRHMQLKALCIVQ